MSRPDVVRRAAVDGKKASVAGVIPFRRGYGGRADLATGRQYRQSHATFKSFKGGCVCA